MINFMERVLNRKYNINQEILNIETLMKESIYGVNIKACITRNFKNWQFNNNYISLTQLYDDTGLKQIVINAGYNMCTINDYIYYAEFVYNILKIAYDSTGRSCDNNSIIKKHIENVLKQIGYEIRYLSDQKYYILIEKDWQVTDSAEILGDKYNLGEEIYIYRHHSMRGRLNEKADILCRIYKHCEDIAPILKNYQYTNLVNDITNLSNNLDIRHAPKDRAKEVINSLSEDELETWYDELFHLCLDAIILADHCSKRKDIKDLSSKLK